MHANASRAVSLLLLVTGITSLSAADWFRWRGPNLDGISEEKDWTAKWPAGGPKVLWRAQAGTGFSSLAVSQGRVYTMGNENDQESVICFDAETGAQVWKHTYHCPIDPNLYEGGPNATPTVDGDRVYSLSRRGDLFCLDAASGKIVWSKNIQRETGAEIPQWGISGSPLVEENLLILNVGTAGTAVDKATGKLAWSNGRGKAGYASPVSFTLDNRRLVAIFGAKALLLVDSRTGRGFASYEWRTNYDVNAADPIITGNLFFISSGYDRGSTLLRLEGNRLTRVWENKTMRNHFNPGVMIGGFIYGIDGNTGRNATLNCLDARTGAVKWSQPGIGAGSLMAADGKLIVLSERGELSVAEASPDGFRPIARHQALGGKCWTTPVLSNGRIYARNARGQVVCLDVRANPVARNFEVE